MRGRTALKYLIFFLSGEYEANLRCPDVGACLPCKERFVSCKNNLNGNHSIIGRPSEYKVCRDGRTVDVVKCDRGAFYDPELGCRLSFDFSESLNTVRAQGYKIFFHAQVN